MNREDALNRIDAMSRMNGGDFLSREWLAQARLHHAIASLTIEWLSEEPEEGEGAVYLTAQSYDDRTIRQFAGTFDPALLPPEIRPTATRFHAVAVGRLMQINSCVHCFGANPKGGQSGDGPWMCPACELREKCGTAPETWWFKNFHRFWRAGDDMGLKPAVAGALRRFEPAVILEPIRPAPVMASPDRWSWGPADHRARTSRGPVPITWTWEEGTHPDRESPLLLGLCPILPPAGTVADRLACFRLSEMSELLRDAAGYPGDDWRDEWDRDFPDYPAATDPWVWLAHMTLPLFMDDNVALDETL